MNIKEYQILAKRTCPALGSLELDLSHMVLGIGSEDEELIKACKNNDMPNIQEEIIDKMWYIANYCTLRHLDLNELFNSKDSFYTEEWEDEFHLSIIHYSKLQDYIKKFIAYKKPIDEKKEINSLRIILFYIQDLLTYFKLNLEKGLENNINKLKVRFPDKFTTENALNRNLEQERLELEK